MYQYCVWLLQKYEEQQYHDDQKKYAEIIRFLHDKIHDKKHDDMLVSNIEKMKKMSS